MYTTYLQKWALSGANVSFTFLFFLKSPSSPHKGDTQSHSDLPLQRRDLLRAICCTHRPREELKETWMTTETQWGHSAPPMPGFFSETMGNISGKFISGMIAPELWWLLKRFQQCCSDRRADPVTSSYCALLSGPQTDVLCLSYSCHCPGAKQLT